MTSHALLSASGAHRWALCPGSVEAEKGRPDTTSVFAARGTLAHEIAEKCLNDDLTAEFFIEEEGVDTELIDGVNEYLNYVRSVVSELDGHLFVEQQVRFDDYIPEGFGTSDASVISPTILEVIDLKMGKGVKVYAHGNPQPELYGLGVLQEFEFLGMADGLEKVRLTIVQPLLDHIDTAEYTIDELREKGELLKVAAHKALEPDAERVPGEKQCQFCKAKADCKALADYNLEVITGDFAEWEKQQSLIAMREPGGLGPNELAAILENASQIKNWLGAIEARATTMIQDGEEVGDWKMVEGRSLRAWLDEEAAQEALVSELDDRAFIKKLLSPAQAEKALGKGHALLETHVTKPPGKPTLAPGRDKRKAIDFCNNPEDDFAAVA